MKTALALLAVLAATGALAQPLPKADIPLERYYQYPLINGRSPAGATMAPDGSKIVFGWNQSGERKLDMWVMDYPSGEKRRILEADSIERLPRQDDTRTEREKEEEKLYDGGISSFQWSPDSKEILFNYRGRTWTVNPDGSNLSTPANGGLSLGGVQYSPDGKYFLYLFGNNLFRMERASGRIKQLTFVSKPNTSIDGFFPSPDGKRIAVTWSDDSKMGRHVMMDFSKDRAEVVNIRRMWAGEQSVNNQIGLVGIEGGLIQWVRNIPRYYWIKDVEWAPNSSRLALGWISEDFQEYTLSIVDPGFGWTTTRYHEKAPKHYIPDWRPVVWERDGSHLLLGTDIAGGAFGLRYVARIDEDGKVETFYKGQGDVVALARPKDSDRVILTTMNRGPLVSEIVVIDPGKAPKTFMPIEDGMATTKNFDDAAPPMFGDDGRRIATMASSRTVPWELFSIEPGVKRLTHSQPAEFDKVKWATMRAVTFKAKDGATVHGLLIESPNLDKSKKHPAFLSNMYANSAKRAWNGFFENYAAMELGFVVLQVDFRASWGTGGEFHTGYKDSMGLVDADEAVAAKEYLVSLGYVDAENVGLWGWSYGGFLTEMAMLTKPGVFKAGVAVAPVTDWRSYNEWYTTRRLGSVKEHEEIYKKTSPLTYPSGLEDHLLMIHGILDDNVLFQDTARLMQALIEKNKHFDLMLYPRDDHGIGKATSRPHVFVEVMAYLWRWLGSPNRTPSTSFHSSDADHPIGFPRG